LSEFKFNNSESKEALAINNLRDLLLNIVESNTRVTDDFPAKPRELNDDFPDREDNESYQFKEEARKLNLPRNSPVDRLASSQPTNFPQVDITRINQLIAGFEQKLQKNANKIDELVDTTNSIIPLIIELLRAKTEISEKIIVAAVVPMVDRIIQQRGQQDLQQMAVALADIIPAAISEEIKRSPAQIARAIAPEIAVAINEQIKLDPNSVSQTLGPEMGKTIKAQIEVEKDAMVDALYPVIGNTISKYLAEAIKSINQQVETALSPAGIKRKIRAKIQGVSEAELILREAINYEVQAVFLIHKASGLVIRAIQPNTEHKLDADMLAGMLTAMRSFVNEYIASDSEELNEIEYGSSKIILEVAGYCYLAAIVKGEPSKQFLEKIRTSLSQIILKYDEAIKNYNGDRNNIPEAIPIVLEKLIETKAREKTAKKPTTLIILAIALLSIIFVPWGIIQYRSYVADRIEHAIAVELDAAPELSIYRIVPQVRGGKITLTGRVPNYYLRNLAEEVVTKIAARENLELHNRIFTVNVPLNPDTIAGEVQRLTKLLNQRSGIEISTIYRNHQLMIEGFVSNKAYEQNLIQTFEQIPGIDTIISKTSDRTPVIKDRIYFASNSNLLELKYNDVIIGISKLLIDNPELNLKIIGHSDYIGLTPQKRELAWQRATMVKAALVAQGIEPSRLRTIASWQSPPGVTPEQPLQASRCVRFETFAKSR
jgi:outer membrane protein OmpA-like peptidoglycan-associated protein